MIFNKFFRWLYNPNEPDTIKREKPNCMKGSETYLENKRLLIIQEISGHNTWVTAGYCEQCSCGFPVDNLEDPKDDITFNVYKVKNDLYCEKDYLEIQLQHAKRGTNWGRLSVLGNVKESADLK